MICGIGTDIAMIDRIRLAIERSGEPFLRRVFTESEIRYCKAKDNPYPHLACIFAAKEAVLKGYGMSWYTTNWKNIEIVLWDNRPGVNLYGKMQDEKERREITDMHLAISYDGEYAVAFSVMEKAR